MALWQEFAQNFYPERADFLVQRFIGYEFASHLVTGEPMLARRDMSNLVASMLRPRGQPWFFAQTNDERINKDPDAKKWLEWATEIQRKFMYERRSQFTRATKEGDNDFVTFGQCVLQVRENSAMDGLVYYCHHLRDVAWLENAELEMEQVHRDAKMRAPAIIDTFGRPGGGRQPLDPKITEALIKDPSRQWKIRHIMIPRDQYDLKDSSEERKRPGSRLPYVSIYLDCENERIIEEVGRPSVDYIIPRWQTVSGSQYAHSPATVVALADARMLQQITLTLLEAGQKSVDPPLIATSEMIQGGVNTFAGGITWVDAEYDEKMGEVLRPLTIDRGGFSWGDALQQRITDTIKRAFFLDQIAMPAQQGEMTAYETQVRFEEYMRRALPLFEPMEAEYNGTLCDATFEILLRNGAFGRVQDMPAILQGQEVKFSFASPLQQAQNRANSQAFMESANLLKIAAELDPTSVHVFDTQTAIRDALEGAQAPATWLNSVDTMQQMAAAQQQQQQEQAMAAQVGQGADIAGKVGDAVTKLTGAMKGGGAPPKGGGGAAPGGSPAGGASPGGPSTPNAPPTPSVGNPSDYSNPAEQNGPQVPSNVGPLLQALQGT